MSERKQRSTRLLSRETVQLMLEMKSLLRRHGIEISLTAPDVHNLLIQAAEAIHDEEVIVLRKRLMAAENSTREPSAPASVANEENLFVDDNDVDEKEAEKATELAFPAPAMASNQSSASTQKLPPLKALKSEDTTVRNVYTQGPFVEDEVNVFLESGDTQRPATKRMVLNTPRTGLLRCDQCQRTNTVKAAGSVDEAIEMTCVCGARYRVLVDARKYDRKDTNLPGFYIDQNDETKTGTIVVENISFGGLRFRTTSPQSLAFGDLLKLQFTLDDDMKTLVWEKVRIHYVNVDVVGVEFINPDKFNKDLAAYLMR